MKSRFINIDILKTIALLLIILAHVNINGYIFQLRNFDVCLMVMISGFLAKVTYKNINIFKYCKKRFSRLVIPVWIFLTFYFILCFFIKPYDLKTIFLSYSLISGIGYVWIIRVYLICALMTPLCIKISNKSLKFNFIFITFILVFNEFLNITKMTDYFLIRELICNALGYGVVYIIGMNLSKLKQSSYYKLGSLFLILFFIILLYHYSINGSFISTQQFKYPPQLYYIAYSMGISLILYGILKNTKFTEKLNNSFVRFTSENSMWIYLLHIISLHLIKIGNQYIRYTLVVILTYILVYIKNLFLKKLNKKYNSIILQYLMN